MHSRRRVAAAVTSAMWGLGVMNGTFVRGAIIITEDAGSTTNVPANSSLVYQTAGSPNSNTSSSTASITSEVFASSTTTFSTPCINQAGDVVFSANSSGGGASTTVGATQNVSGLYAQLNGTLTLIAHEGTYAPDRAGNAGSATSSTGTFYNFSAGSAFSNNYIGTNDVVTDIARYKGDKTGGGSDDSATFAATTGTYGTTTSLNGIISTRSGSLALLYRQNDTPLVSTNGLGATINSINPNAGLYDEAVTPSGTIGAAFDTGSPSGTYVSFVSDVGGTLSFVAQHGANSVVTGATYNGATAYNSAWGPVINKSGQMAFRDDLAGSVINSNNSAGIFSQGGGTLHLVAQGYQQAPSTVAGDAIANLTSSSIPDMNNAGQVVFVDTLVNNASLGAGDIVGSTNNSSGATANNSGIFAEYTVGNLSLVARKGNAAFGQNSNTVYGGFNNPVINDGGRIAVEASLSNIGGGTALTTGTTSAFYEFDPNGNVTLVAQAGQPAPGTPYLFGNFGLNNFAINATGQMVFETPLVSTVGGTATISNSVFAQDTFGNLDELLYVGESYTIGPGDVSTISSISQLINSGGEDGKQLSWNDNADLAVTVQFANGQSAVLTVAVPEPTSVALLAAASAGLLSRRRRAMPV